MKTTTMNTKAVKTLKHTMLVAKCELASMARLRSSAIRSGNLRKYESYTQALRAKLQTHIDMISAKKAGIVEELVLERTNQITPLQFQDIVDAIPLYQFTDLATGRQYDQIAYGTVGYRQRLQLKAEVASAKVCESNEKLAWVDQALRNWTKTYLKPQANRAVAAQLECSVQGVA